MSPEDRAQALRREADEVLELVRLREHCAGIGELTPTGSYFLDLMMYPDIDVYLPPTSAHAMMTLGARLAESECVKELKFDRGWAEEQGDLAGGLYLKAVIAHGHWERRWKIDIWSLPTAVAAKKHQELADLKARMTPEHRQVILNYKHSILTDTGRTPMFSGIFIYRGVINEGLRDFALLTAYLRANGIDV